MGPMETTSVGGSRYALTFIDDFSRYTMVYFMKRQSQVFDFFLKCNSMMERKPGKKVKCSQNDNGIEYVNKEFARECRSRGILQEITVS